jgi:hypothetical protein
MSRSIFRTRRWVRLVAVAPRMTSYGEANEESSYAVNSYTISTACEISMAVASRTHGREVGARLVATTSRSIRGILCLLLSASVPRLSQTQGPVHPTSFPLGALASVTKGKWNQNPQGPNHR